MPIEIENLSYDYPSHTRTPISALRGITVKIQDGEFVGIMGHTGCGKTTFIQLMAGLLAPTAGKILLDGENIFAKNYDRSQLRRKLGIVFQYPEYQLFETTVEKDVAFGLQHSGLTQAEITRHVRWSLETMAFSFEEIRSQSPLALSGGEKRRVAIAGVLVTRPQILIFDEPIAGLDPIGRKSFLETLSKLQKAGTTIVMVSHNADAIAEFANRVLVLDKGVLVADGTAKEIFTDTSRLKQLKLQASSPKQITDLLLSRGVPIPPDTVRYDDLLSALREHYTGGSSL